MATARRGSTATGKLVWQLPQTIATTTFPLRGQTPLPPPTPVPPPVPPPEPPPMPVPTMPRDVYDVCQRFAARFPPPQRRVGESASAHDGRCREWSIMEAEQVAFEKGRDYGVKRASPTRPISKDSLARASDMTSWDMLLGVGTGTPTFPAYPPQAHDISSQVFVAVVARDHLGPVPPPVEPPPVEPPPVPVPPVTYHQFVGVEAQQVADKYQAVHGRVPAASDLYHNAWRRLVEGWSHQAILDDIR